MRKQNDHKLWVDRRLKFINIYALVLTTAKWKVLRFRVGTPPAGTNPASYKSPSQVTAGPTWTSSGPGPMATRPPGVGVALSGYDTGTNSPPKFQQLARHWALRPPLYVPDYVEWISLKFGIFFKNNFRIKLLNDSVAPAFIGSTYLYIQNATSRSMVC